MSYSVLARIIKSEAEIIQAFKDGKTPKEVAQSLGCGVTTLYDALFNIGINRRDYVNKKVVVDKRTLKSSLETIEYRVIRDPKIAAKWLAQDVARFKDRFFCKSWA